MLTKKRKFNKKSISKVVLVFTILFFAFVVPGGNSIFGFGAGVPTAQATDNALMTTLYTIVGTIVNSFASFLGSILSLFVYALSKIASFQDITNIGAVTTGWGVVRDICNMFFILILLVISFGTILRLENYSAKRLLPKLLIMAVLINFSKFIAGIMIDFGQVIMLTFIDGLGSNPAAVFVDRMSIQYVLDFSPTAGSNAEATANLALTALQTVLGGVMMLLVSLVVIVVLMLVLLMRIVMLWILVILSPLAFLASVLPTTAKYASQWWSEFVKWVVVGPMVAFFVWLALVGISTNNEITEHMALTENWEDSVGAANNAALDEGIFLPYIITVALLMGGLVAAQSAGGLAGAAAGNAIGRLKKAPGAIGRRVGSSASDLGLNMANKPIRAGFGAVAGSKLTSGYGLGAVAAATGLRGLATRGLSGLDKRQKRKGEDAEKYIKNISDPRVLGRFANAKGPMTAWKKSLRDAARAKSPSLVEAGQRQAAFNKLSEDDLKKMKPNEWRRLGGQHQRGEIDLRQNTQATHMAQRNANIRGEVNAGADDGVGRAIGTGATDSAGTALFRGYDANGNPHAATAGSFGNHRRTGDFNAYRKVEGDEANAARGDGNMSVTNARFLEGKSNTVAANFDELNIDELKDGKDEKFQNIKGVNVSDSGTIKKVADKMVSAIESQLKKLEGKRRAIEGKSNANITLQDQKDLQSIETQHQRLSTAKDRFSNPEEMKNLRLVNSSAHGYKGVNDVKKTMIHEEIHDHVRDEGDTEKLTQYVIDNKKYSKRDNVAQEYAKSDKTVDEFIDDHSKREGWKAPERKSVEDVVAAEKSDSGHGPSKGENVPANVKNSATAVAQAKGDKNLAIAITAMAKSIKEQAAKTGEGMGKIASGLSEIGDISPSTSSLELNVMQKKVQQIFNENKNELS